MTARKKMLRIADKLSVPLSIVTAKTAILGMGGSGKSWLMMLLAEKFLEVHAQTVFLDPKGEAWGLRLMADGKTPAFPIPIFGGEHGDIPITPTMGRIVAEMIVERNYSAVIDVSEFTAQEHYQFNYDFATRLFELKKKKPGAMSLMIDEAQDFIPQNLSDKGMETKMLAAFNRVVKNLRSKGVGIVMASPRPQEVNKKSLNLSEVWFCFQMTGLSERETMEKYFLEKDKEEAAKIKNLLPSLSVGLAHVWSPRLLKVSDQFNIGQRKTFDSSATPEVGARRVVARKLSVIDIGKLTESMKEVIDEAKAKDPDKLLEQIQLLTSERNDLAARVSNLESRQAKSNDKPARVKTETKVVEKKIMVAGDLTRAERIVERIEKLQLELETTSNNLAEPLAVIAGVVHDARLANEAEVGKVIEREPLFEVETVPGTPVQLGSREARKLPTVTREYFERRHESAEVSSNGDGDSLPEGERVILAAIAQHQKGLTPKQVTAITGYKKSSRNTYLSRLRSKGCIISRDGRDVATGDGVRMLGSDYKPLPTHGRPLVEHLQKTLPSGEWKCLQAILAPSLAAYSNGGNRVGVTPARISEVTGFEKSSRNTYVSRLCSREVVERSDGNLYPNSILLYR